MEVGGGDGEENEGEKQADRSEGLKRGRVEMGGMKLIIKCDTIQGWDWRG